MTGIGRSEMQQIDRDQLHAICETHQEKTWNTEKTRAQSSRNTKLPFAVEKNKRLPQPFVWLADLQDFNNNEKKIKSIWRRAQEPIDWSSTGNPSSVLDAVDQNLRF